MNATLKDISGWDATYVRGLPVGEFDWLDFKDSRWLDLTQACLDKLSKYASAFANFDGGYLVIGVRDPHPAQLLEIDGGVSLTLKPDLKGWLEDILPRLTDPPLERLNVHLLGHTPGSGIHPGNALAIIHIPGSSAAPHQATDHKYYARVGTKLSPLGHRAVLDILNRHQNPIVRTDIYININRHGGAHNILWRLTNLSDVFARYVMTRMQIPVVIAGQHISFKDQNKLVLDDGSTTVWPLTGSNHIGSPLFPRGTVSRRFEFELAGPAGACKTRPEITYKTYADRMPPQYGTIAVEDALNLTRDKKTAEPLPPTDGSPATGAPSGEA